MQNERAVGFHAGSLTLEGWLATPAQAETAVVICHPHPQYGGDMDNDVVTTLAGHLQRAGIATLRFNFRGTGKSEGRYDNGIGETDDARAATALLRSEASGARIVLAGYSFGAMIALMAGHDAAEIDRLIAIAPPLAMMDASFLRSSTKSKLFLLGDRDQYCPFATLEQFVATIAGTNRVQRLAGADHFLQGADSTIGRSAVEFLQSAD